MSSPTYKSEEHTPIVPLCPEKKNAYKSTLTQSI